MFSSESCSTVFALHERESGELTEKMLQKQEQLRVHVRELEKALHEREEDEVSGQTCTAHRAMYLPRGERCDRQVAVQRARERAMHAIQQQNETLHLELQQ
jgi:hypothetical protein